MRLIRYFDYSYILIQLGSKNREIVICSVQLDIQTGVNLAGRKQSGTFRSQQE